jgi:hypothetical protein
MLTHLHISYLGEWREVAGGFMGKVTKVVTRLWMKVIQWMVHWWCGHIVLANLDSQIQVPFSMLVPSHSWMRPHKVNLHQLGLGCFIPICVSFNPLLAWGPKMIKNLWNKLIFVVFTLRGLIKQCIVDIQALLVNIIQIIMIGKTRKLVFNYYVLGFSKKMFLMYHI